MLLWRQLTKHSIFVQNCSTQCIHLPSRVDVSRILRFHWSHHFYNESSMVRTNQCESAPKDDCRTVPRSKGSCHRLSCWSFCCIGNCRMEWCVLWPSNGVLSMQRFGRLCWLSVWSPWTIDWSGLVAHVGCHCCQFWGLFGDKSPNVSPTFGHIAPFWAPTMPCHFGRLPTCRLHICRN